MDPIDPRWVNNYPGDEDDDEQALPPHITNQIAHYANSTSDPVVIAAYIGQGVTADQVARHMAQNGLSPQYAQGSSSSYPGSSSGFGHDPYQYNPASSSLAGSGYGPPHYPASSSRYAYPQPAPASSSWYGPSQYYPPQQHYPSPNYSSSSSSHAYPQNYPASSSGPPLHEPHDSDSDEDLDTQGNMPPGWRWSGNDPYPNEYGLRSPGGHSYPNALNLTPGNRTSRDTQALSRFIRAAERRGTTQTDLAREIGKNYRGYVSNLKTSLPDHLKDKIPTAVSTKKAGKASATKVSREQRQENARNGAAYMTPERRQEIGQLGGMATTERLTPAQLSERGRLGALALSPEKRREISRLGGNALAARSTPAERQQRARNAGRAPRQIQGAPRAAPRPMPPSMPEHLAPHADDILQWSSEGYTHRRIVDHLYALGIPATEDDIEAVIKAKTIWRVDNQQR